MFVTTTAMFVMNTVKSVIDTVKVVSAFGRSVTKTDIHKTKGDRVSTKPTHKGKHICNEKIAKELAFFACPQCQYSYNL